MGKLILIKHAAPEVNAETPPEAWHLSPEGRAKAEALAALLASHAPHVVVTSGEVKAVETGDVLAHALSIPVERVAGLAEHDRSNVPQMQTREFISMMELVFRKPRQLVLGRETAAGALARFRNALDDVIEAHRDKDTVAVVSHGTVIALFLADVTGKPAFEYWRRMKLPSYAVLELPSMEMRELVESVG
jgi:broad specificity phosphatase PhoE